MSKLILCGSCGYTIAGNPQEYNSAILYYDLCDTCHTRMVTEEEHRLKLYYETLGDRLEADNHLREVFKDYQQGDTLSEHLIKWTDMELSKERSPFDA